MLKFPFVFSVESHCPQDKHLFESSLLLIDVPWCSPFPWGRVLFKIDDCLFPYRRVIKSAVGDWFCLNPVLNSSVWAQKEKVPGEAGGSCLYPEGSGR